MSTVALNPVIDLFVSQGSPTTSYNSDHRTMLAYNNVDTPTGAARSWFKFDLRTIPVGATITSATLTIKLFYAHDDRYTAPINIELERSTTNTWTTALTWNTQPSTVGSPTTTISGEIGYTEDLVFTGLASDVSAALMSGYLTYRMRATIETTGPIYMMHDVDYPGTNPAVLDVTYTAPTTAFGINHRDTSGYVTDGAGETYCLGQNDLYPTTRGGKTFGWDSFGDISRNRDSAVDRRLAGDARIDDATQKVWRCDHAAGTYPITIGQGSAGIFSSSYNYLEVLDNTTTVLTIDDTNGVPSGNHNDSTGTQYSSSSWPGSSVATNCTFATSTIFVKMGKTAATGSFHSWNHIHVGDAASTPAPKRMLLLGVG